MLSGVHMPHVELRGDGTRGWMEDVFREVFVGTGKVASSGWLGVGK